MSKNKWEFTMPESYLKTERMLDKIRLSVPSVEISKALQAAMPVSVFKTQGMLDQLSIPALEISNALRAAIPEYNFTGIAEALRESTVAFQALQKVVLPTDALRELAVTMQALPKIEIPNFTESILAQIDTSAITAWKECADTFANTDWSWLSEVYEEDQEKAQEMTVDEVPSEIRTQIAADITEVLSDPENLHTVSQNKYLEWKNKRPENAALFWQTLCQIIQTIMVILTFGVTVWQAFTNKDSRVYEEPTTTSTVVYNITVNNPVTVIGDVPYYYEVEFPNPETGELVKGFVPKRNLTADVPETTEDQEEEETTTEVPETTVEATEPPTVVSE